MANKYQAGSTELMRQASCTLCGSTDLTDFYSIANVPITCTSVFATSQEAASIPSGRIDLCICNDCCLIYNRSFDRCLGEIGARYESSQGASAVFEEYSRSLARDWVERYSLAGKRVLEIGSGSGSFLTHLIDCGVAQATGIDPLADRQTLQCDDARITLIPEYFADDHFKIDAEALVCRHTLEHIDDIRGFLNQLRHWAERNPHSVVLFEIPDAERIFNERAFWDIYYEHCNYFTLDTVRAAFEIAGFSVVSVKRSYSDQYLLIEAVMHREQTPSIQRSRPPCPKDDYLRFADDVGRSIGNCRRALWQLGTPSRPVILWQGAAKTVGLITALAEAHMIGGAVDMNPQRHGQFLPGSGLQIMPPEWLLEIRPRYVVLMNPVYLAEVRALIASLGVDATDPMPKVYSINTLLGNDFDPAE